MRSSKLKNFSYLKGELVLDNLFINQPASDNTSDKNLNIDTELNKFNTDFYKLCSDTFLNESTYGLTSNINNITYQV